MGAVFLEMSMGTPTILLKLLVAVSCVSAVQALWQDCGHSNATLHFTSIISDPDPLKTGDNQTISKTGWSDQDFAASDLSSSFSQYWCFTDCKHSDGSIKWQTGLPWIRFLKINVDVCADHPDMCPIKAGHNFTTSAVHPKLNPLTPHGWYRSRQEYKDKRTGQYVGCADMIFEYVSAVNDDDAVFNPLNSA